MINGQTIEPGKTIIVQVASIPVPIRCVAIEKRSVTVEFFGVTEVIGK